MSDDYKPRKLTEKDWKRIHAAIPKYAGFRLDTTPEGTCIIYPHGAMHPIAFLSILDELDKETIALAEKIAVAILERAPYDLGLTTKEVVETFGVLEIERGHARIRA